MVKHFSSLNFRHSISITHHSSLITHHSFFHTHLAISLLFSSLNFFTLFMGLTPISQYSVFFLFFIFLFLFFFSVPNSPKLILKKKKKLNGQPRKRKEKKRKKKKSKGGQKLRLWILYVCLITILPLSYELWKLKTAKSCFQFS